MFSAVTIVLATTPRGEPAEARSDGHGKLTLLPAHGGHRPHEAVSEQHLQVLLSGDPNGWRWRAGSGRSDQNTCLKPNPRLISTLVAAEQARRCEREQLTASCRPRDAVYPLVCPQIR